MPLGKNVSANIRELKAAHPEWPHKRIVAAALNAARRAGGRKVPRKKRKHATRRRSVKVRRPGNSRAFSNKELERGYRVVYRKQVRR